MNEIKKLLTEKLAILKQMADLLSDDVRPSLAQAKVKQLTQWDERLVAIDEAFLVRVQQKDMNDVAHWTDDDKQRLKQVQQLIQEISCVTKSIEGINKSS